MKCESTTKNKSNRKHYDWKAQICLQKIWLIDWLFEKNLNQFYPVIWEWFGLANTLNDSVSFCLDIFSIIKLVIRKD